MVLAILITFLSFFVRWRDRDMPRRSHFRKPNSRMACAQLEAAADPVDRAVRFFVNCRQSLAETLPVQSVGPLVCLADLLPLSGFLYKTIVVPYCDLGRDAPHKDDHIVGAWTTQRLPCTTSATNDAAPTRSVYQSIIPAWAPGGRGLLSFAGNLLPDVWT